jgi:glycosyltransferase involved in cell wall biosynthesis
MPVNKGGCFELFSWGRLWPLPTDKERVITELGVVFTPSCTEPRKLMEADPKILWISQRYPPQTGGMAVGADRQVSGLRSRDLRVDVVALTDSGEGAAIKSVSRDCGTDYYLRVQPGGAIMSRELWGTLAEEHSARPYTYAVGFGASLAGFLAATFAAWLRCPSLVLVRGNDFDQDWFHRERGFWVRESLFRTSVVGVVSGEMGRRVAALFPEKNVTLVPNGIDTSQWALLPRDRAKRNEIRSNPRVAGRRIIGLFGELKYKKGVAPWLGALRDAQLLDRTVLLIVGDRIDAETEQILSNPSLVPPVIRVPFAHRDHLAGLYAACDYVALPSLFDGMPNVLLEAMAVGVVPIVSDAGAMCDVVCDSETGFVFKAGDLKAAAEALRRALGISEEKREFMGLRAREHVKRFYSVERELDVLCEILMPEA